MEILPRDLGQWRTVALMRLRATIAQMQTAGYSTGNTAASAVVQDSARAVANRSANAPSLAAVTSSASEKPMGFWTRFWAGGTTLEPDAARAAVRSMSGLIGGLAGGLGGGSVGLLAPGVLIALFGHDPTVGVILAGLGAAMAGLGISLPRYLMTQYATKPLTSAEMELLANATDDPTEKAYLSVVADVLRQPALPSAQTEKDVRSALRTLGEAIDKLPRVTTPHQNADDLRGEAQKAFAEADAEPDALIAASLRRRAEAQEKTAQTAQKSALLVRRADALRREIEAQMEALRMGLSGFDVGTADAAQNHDAAQSAAARLSQLAHSVQSVAREAGSLTDARDEVATWMQQPVSAAAADVVLVGRTR